MKSFFYTCLVVVLLCSPCEGAQKADWDLVRKITTDRAFNIEDSPDLLRHPAPTVRKACLLRLIQDADPRNEYLVIPFLDDSVWSIRLYACRYLEKCGTDECLNATLRTVYFDDHYQVRTRAVRVLGHLRSDTSRLALFSLLDDPSFAVRGTAVKQLRHFPRPKQIKRIRNMAIDDPVPYVRIRAAATLKAWGVIQARRISPMIIFLILPICLMLIPIIYCPFRIPAVWLLLIYFLFVLNTAVDYPQFREDFPSRIIIDSRVFKFGTLGKLDNPIAFIDGVRKEIVSKQDALPVYINSMPELWIEAYHPVRKQYNAAILLRRLLYRQPSGERTLLITGRDIYQEPFHHAMGYGLPGVSVVSIRRIDPLFLGEGNGSTADIAVFRERLVKLIRHEVGHMRGLSHCKKPGCPMNFIRDVELFFASNDVYCISCLENLAVAVKILPSPCPGSL